MRLRVTAISFAFLFVAALAWASSKEGEPFGPVPADELKMTSEPLAPGAPAINLYRQVDRDDSGTQGKEYNYIRIKILTEEGRKYADVEIPFLKGGGRSIVGIKARTVRPDGTTIDYDGKVYDKQIVKAKGIKYMAKTFTMPEVQVGSIIEYAYTEDLAENLVYDSHWILSDELFTKRAQVFAEALRAVRLSLDMEPSTKRHGGTEGRTRPHRPSRGEEHSGVPDRRLHAAGERAEIPGRLLLQRLGL